MRIARVALVSSIVGVTAVSSVACSIDGRAVAAKPERAPLVSLMPLEPDAKLVGSDRELSCPKGLTPILLSSNLARNKPVGDTGVTVDVHHRTNRTNVSTEAVYTFNGTLPKVHSVIATFLTPERVDIHFYPPLVSARIGFWATWPKDSSLPLVVSVETGNFNRDTRNFADLTLCTNS